MLNLIKLNNIKKKITKKEKKTLKHFASSVREWKNSIYVYNKNALNLIPTITNSAMILIKGYFLVFNKKIEQKLRTKRFLFRFRRLSSNKIYISNGEFKHTNNKVLITLYIFNRQKNNYLLFIKKWYLKAFLGKNGLKERKINNFEKYFFKLLKHINFKGSIALKSINNNKYLFQKTMNKINKENVKNNIYVSNYLKNFYKKLLNKWLIRLQYYLYYKQLTYINRSKLNYNYLQFLKKHLENLYNKNVEFNLVNLKRFYLNSDILSEAITIKITKNRRGILKYLKLFKNKIKPQTKRIFLNETIKKNRLIKDLSLDKSFRRNIIDNLKYKHLTGFRIEANGRLTRRYTASRSVSKVIYKGNLLDLDSTYKGLSSVVLKGNLESNLQYTKLNSSTRIGSFGIKGWVSGN